MCRMWQKVQEISDLILYTFSLSSSFSNSHADSSRLGAIRREAQHTRRCCKCHCAYIPNQLSCRFSAAMGRSSRISPQQLIWLFIQAHHRDTSDYRVSHIHQVYPPCKLRIPRLLFEGCTSSRFLCSRGVMDIW